MDIEGIVVNEGRAQLINYLRNSEATPQDDYKFYIKSFQLYKSLSGLASQATTFADLQPDVLDGVPVTLQHPVSARLSVAGNKLNIQCVVDNAWSSDVDDISGIGLVFEDALAAEALFAYAVFANPFNKVANSNLTFNFKIQF